MSNHATADVSGPVNATTPNTTALNTAALDAAASTNGDASSFNGTTATAEARIAVCEYLQDLGLRDPDVIARQSREIVAEALDSCDPSKADDVEALCEASIELTVKRLGRFLELLGEQSGNPVSGKRIEGVIAARLPALLAKCPQAFGQQQMPHEFAGSLNEVRSPVVPRPHPHQMPRQGLVLVPAYLKRLSHHFRSLLGL